MLRSTLPIAFALTILVTLFAVTASADPLPGETLKFLNSPLMVSPTNQYPGHDEVSTVYPVAGTVGYTGQYMADDFADKFNTPVVHVQWWGSYIQGFAGTGVKEFLIAFESDVPAGPNGEPSHPGTILSSQIVTLGALQQGSGTFTEAALPNPGSPDGNALYQYNAELSVPFAEKADTVYWLKIVAIVNPAKDGQISWGWHDRDWSIPNTLASTAPAVVPGEHVTGIVTPGVSVNHFQDDAVAGAIGIGGFTTPVPGPISPSLIDQAIGQPQNYILPYDGPAGVPGQIPGIDSFSKDLAFALYTRVPEPSSMVLCILGVFGLAAMSRRRAT